MVYNMELYQKTINEQLLKIGHTKSSFCRSIGIGRMTFDRYLNGDNMNTQTVKKIEEGLYGGNR